MTLEPHDDEREFFTNLEIFTPRVLPGIKVGATFRRKWTRARTERFVDNLSAESGLSRNELRDRLQQDDEITDLFANAAMGANDNGSKEYSELLARLVAAALIDDAKVDPISYLIERFTQLSPVHLRVLAIIHDADKYDASIAKAHVRYDAVVEWIDSTPAVYDGKIRVGAVSGKLDLPDGIVESCLGDLTTVGFVTKAGGEYRQTGSKGRSFDFFENDTYVPITWHLTRLGRAAADEVNAIRRDIARGG